MNNSTLVDIDATVHVERNVDENGVRYLSIRIDYGDVPGLTVSYRLKNARIVRDVINNIVEWQEQGLN